MANVISMISGGEVGELTLPGSPVENVIKSLEEMLKEAKEGKLVALAAATVYDRGAGLAVGTEIAFRGDTVANLSVAMRLLDRDYLKILE